MVSGVPPQADSGVSLRPEGPFVDLKAWDWKSLRVTSGLMMIQITLTPDTRNLKPSLLKCRRLGAFFKQGNHGWL